MRIVSLVLIVLMTLTTFITQKQLMVKGMPTGRSNPLLQQQKILVYVFPFMFAVFGINFPIGVLFYWLTTNLWSMGQQYYVIRRNPAPGSPACAEWEERQARKAAKEWPGAGPLPRSSRSGHPGAETGSGAAQAARPEASARGAPAAEPGPANLPNEPQPDEETS